MKEKRNSDPNTPGNGMKISCNFIIKNILVAKYSKTAGKKVKEAMHELKEGKLKSGSGKKVTSRKQAIAIGLSEAREKGAKVPKEKTASKAEKK
ncbi:MAG: DUF2408 domain-containing protein [Bacteroidota bacterium]|nr:DUF2408 domain-containing protein [Bacteroidota bacterium]